MTQGICHITSHQGGAQESINTFTLNFLGMSEKREGQTDPGVVEPGIELWEKPV